MINICVNVFHTYKQYIQYSFHDVSLFHELCGHNFIDIVYITAVPFL